VLRRGRRELGKRVWGQRRLRDDPREREVVLVVVVLASLVSALDVFGGANEPGRGESRIFLGS
jgi:hypothetical protein